MNVAIFEGPASERLRGWRHYQIRLSNGAVRTCAGEPRHITRMVKELRARFFAAGTWEETDGQNEPANFPLPRREILELLSGSNATAKPRNDFDHEPLFCGAMRANQMPCAVGG